LSLFRYFEVGLRVCDIVVKKFTFAISSADEFLFILSTFFIFQKRWQNRRVSKRKNGNEIVQFSNQESINWNGAINNPGCTVVLTGV